MAIKLISIREVVEPIIGGFWGQTVDEPGTGNARVVRNGDILESGYISTKAPERILTEKEVQKSKLQNGDILITMSGNVGRVARVIQEIDSNGLPFVASNFVKILRPKKVIDADYLYFYLKSKDFQSEIKKYTRGVAIQNLSTKVFDQQLVPELSLAQQKEIATKLRQVEDLKKKRIDADQKMKKVIPALFNKMFGNPDTNEKGWELEKLNDVCETIYRYPTFYGIEYKNIGIPVIRIGNIMQNGIIDPNLSNYILVDQAINNKFPKTVIQLFDILMAVRGDGSTGKRIGLVTSEKLVGANMSPNLLRFKTDERVLNAHYLFHLMISGGGQEIIGRKITRTAKKTITSADIVGIKIPIPPISLQNEFAENVKSILNLGSKQEESLLKINNLFDSLLSNSLTK